MLTKRMIVGTATTIKTIITIVELLRTSRLISIDIYWTSTGVGIMEYVAFLVQRRNEHDDES